VKIGHLQMALILVCVLTVRGASATQATDEPASQQAPQEPATAAPLQDEDPVSPLVPKQPRDDRDQDRLTAAALFAHGRLLFRQQKFADALKRYERAWRYAPGGTPILTDIVPLALRLKRNDEAVRYAIIAAENDHSDIERLRRIASLLRQQRQFPRALKLYEILDKIQRAQPVDFSYLALQIELGKLYFLTNQAEASAKVLGLVKTALHNPGKYGLSDQQKKQLEGKNGATYLVIAESMLMDGKGADAEAMFREAHRVTPDETMLAFRVARTLENRQQPEKALEQLDIFLAAKTGNQGTAPFQLLERLIKQQFKQEAEASQRYLEKLLELQQADTKNQPLTYQLAQVQFARKNYADAVKLYDALLAGKPTADAYRGVISVFVTRLAKIVADQPAAEQFKWSADQKDQWQTLTKHLTSFVGGSGSLDPLGEDLADQILNDKRFLSQLLGQLRAQLSLEVSDEPADENPAVAKPAEIEPLAITAGLIAVRGQQWDAADAFFAKALEAAENKPARVLEIWGMQMLMAEQFERSAEVLQQAVEHPNINNKRSFFFLLAGAAAMADQTDNALAAARQAIDLSPKIPRIHSRVGWVYYHAGRYPEAEQHYRALITKFGSEYNSSDTRDVLRQARLTLSNLCVLQDRWADAEEWLEEVLDEFPEDIGAMNDLGYLWIDQNKHLHRGLLMIQTAVTAEPENIAYRDSLGWAHYRLGNYQQAVKELEKAAGDPEPDSVILDHLGDAYLKTKSPEKARKTWQRALDALEEDAKESTRNKIQEKLNPQKP